MSGAEWFVLFMFLWCVAACITAAMFSALMLGDKMAEAEYKRRLTERKDSC